MTRSVGWCWIFVVVFQCLGLIYAASGNSDNGHDCSFHGATVTFRGLLGPEAGATTEGHLQWLNEESGEEKSCKLNVKTVQAEGAYYYEVSVTLPECTPHCNPELRLNTKLHCATLPLNNLNVEELGDTELHVPISFFSSCQHGNRHTRSITEKREWAGDDMQWLKRSTLDDWPKMHDALPFGYNKKFDTHTMNWLKKRSPEYPWMQKKPTWNAGGVNWLKKRAWNKANTEWLKRGWGQDADMNWLKRGWSFGDAQWLKKRSEPEYDLYEPEKRWDHGEIMDWLKKRSVDDEMYNTELDKRAWENANTEWIKRDTGMHHIHRIIKRDTSQQQSEIDLKKRAVGDDHEMDKKNWGASGMSWIKRDEGKDKKNWGSSGMSWIKRDDEPEKKNWGASGMSWIKRENEKRNWGASGMSWIKRNDENNKRNWGASGMSWIKRNPDQKKRNWGASGMSWIKRGEGDDSKRNWGASGMSWIKRDKEDKRNWGGSGMSWIKRNQGKVNKKNWGASGMSWIKRADDDQKRNWGASGMSWIKRDGDDNQKRNWGGSGMSWIKRDGDDNQKRNWGGSGMSWIKRDGDDDQKRNWGASGMSWIKRDEHEADKKNWGASGMSWIKRDPENNVLDQSDVAYAQKTLDKMINDKVVPPVQTRSWPKESEWLKRSDPEQRRAWGVEQSNWIKRDTSSLAVNDLESKAHSSVNKANAEAKDIEPEIQSQPISGAMPVTGVSSSSASDSSATAH